MIGAMTGTLVLAATPIGQVGDAPPRLAHELATADVVAAEDTRRLRRLCSDLGVEVGGRVVSYFEGNEQARARLADLYLDRLRPGGVLVMNISNRHLDLRPVVRHHAAARDLQLSVVTSPSQMEQGLARARWVLLARHDRLHRWLGEKGALDARTADDAVAWSDDFTPLFPVMRALR